MSIIRSPRPDSNFSVISNQVVRDSRLSYRARGILLEILSRPDNWRISAESLARTGQEGRAAILGALKELRIFGYLKTVKERNEDGRFETNSYIYDIPTGVRLPNAGKPESGKPESENLTPLEELSKKNLDISDSPKGDSEQMFDKFWAVYPRKVAKGAARKAWEKITDYEVVIAGAERFSLDPNREDTFTPHPATWLNAERWLDDPLPPRRLTVEELKERELLLARKRDAEARERTLRALEEEEARKARAVPMPEDIKKLLGRA